MAETGSEIIGSSSGTEQAGERVKMPLRDARSGKPGSSGSSSARDESWSDEAKGAGTGAEQTESREVVEDQKDIEGDW